MYVGTVLYSVSAKLLIPDVIPNDKLIPNLLMQVTNPVTAALLMCGITAASLSTANSQIHALSQILTFDIYRKTVSKHRENLSEHRLLSVGKWSIIVVSALAYLLMIYGSVHIIEIGMVSMEESVAICPDLIRAAGFLPNERVDIYNVNNGERFSTYVMSLS